MYFNNSIPQLKKNGHHDHIVKIIYCAALCVILVFNSFNGCKINTKRMQRADLTGL